MMYKIFLFLEFKYKMNSVLKTSLNKIYHTLQELKENGYFHMQRLFQFHQNDSTDTESEDDSILELDK